VQNANRSDAIDDEAGSSYSNKDWFCSNNGGRSRCETN
jgi:hypothetical protein